MIEIVTPSRNVPRTRPSAGFQLIAAGVKCAALVPAKAIPKKVKPRNTDAAAFPTHIRRSGSAITY